MRTDFFNEALVTTLLAVSSGKWEEMAQSGPDGEALAEAEALRERLLALLDRAGRAATQAGLSAVLVEAADFAVCAFIDEILLSSPAWPGRMDWMQKPLQIARHGTATAGEDFYRLLDSLLEQADTEAPIGHEVWDADEPPLRNSGEAQNPLCAVLEIYALCLAQGFTGMFYDDPEAVRNRLDKIGRFVPAVHRRAAPFFFEPAEKAEARKPLWSRADLIRRFDPLDLALWSVPPVLTLLLYYVCQTRLDRLLRIFLQGSALS
ncbi:MAG: DotU family type IV/VI secretion system protein [Desulfovibrionaceae bacterium]|nr:DotU family type IV/VI secretion system protein [Desulfovibrionaceae bacterium]